MKNARFLLGLLLMLLAATPAYAVITIGIGSASGAAGSTVSVPVTLFRPAGDTNAVFSASFRYDFPNPPLSASFSPSGAVPPAGAATSCGLAGGNRLLCSLTTNPATAIAVGSYVLGTVTFVVAPSATGVQTVSTTVLECTDSVGNSLPGACASMNGMITTNSEQAPITIRIGSGSGAAGSTVSVPVLLSRPFFSREVFSASFRFDFPNPPLSASFSSAGASPPANASTACGLIGGSRLQCALTTSPATAINFGDYVLGTVTFALAAAPQGTQTVSSTVIECTDGVGTNLPGACVGANGTISVLAAAVTYATPPSTLTFPALALGSNASANVPVAASSGNTTALQLAQCTISGSNAADFSVISPVGASTVAAGSATNVVVRFAPTATTPASRTATLSCATPNATAPSGAAFSVGLSGSVIQPSVNYAIPAASLVFSATAAGNNSSLNVPVSASAANNAALQLSQCTISGANSADFSVSSPVGASTVAAGSTSNVVVRFAPTGSAPASRTATLNCPTPNATTPNSMAFSVNLSGPVLQPTITYSAPPATLSFASTLPGTSVTAQIALTAAAGNTAPLQLGQCTIAGPDAADFSVSSPLGASTIAAGATANVVVRFAPTSASAANRSATLNCPTPNATAPSAISFSVALTGPIAPAAIGALTAAGAVNLGQLSVGQSRQRSFVFTNTSSVAGNVSCLLSNAPGYSLTPPGALSVPANGTGSYSLTFSASNPGSFSGTLDCTGSALVGSPISYALSILVLSPQAAPTLAMVATPTSAPVLSAITISWSLSTADGSCVPSGAAGSNWATLGTLPEAGARAVNLPATPGVSTFTLTCSNSAGSVSASVTATATAIPAPPPTPPVQSQTNGSTGQDANNASARPTVSDRASFIAFESVANNLIPGDTNSAQDVFVRNRLGNSLSRASVDANGAQLSRLVSGEPAIARDGLRVAFVTGTGILQTGAQSATRRVSNGQVRIYDARTGRATPISNAANGMPGNGTSNYPHMVDNLVVFQSEASNLGAEPDSNGVSDIFAHDLSSGVTTLLSAPNPGVASQGSTKAAGCGSARPHITVNNIAVFESCQVLSSGVTSTAISHIYATTALAKRSTLITRSAAGTAGSADSNNATISSDGSYVYFDSAADNLVASDTNGQRDVFRARITLSGSSLSVGPVERVSLSVLGAEGNGPSERPTTCGNGRYVTFESEATNLFPRLGGSAVRNILAKDMATGVIAKLSQTSAGIGATGASSEPTLSPDCSAAAFATEASNLSSIAQPGKSDVVLGSNPLNTNYTGHWQNPSESGWGLTVAHQGDTLFPNWFTFDTDGKPLWLGMLAGARLQPDGSFSGDLYRLRGVPFNLINGNPAFTSAPIVGQAKLTFTDAEHLRFDYTVGAVSQSKLLEPLTFAERSVCEFAPSEDLLTASNYTDVWDNSASESGWGIHLTHQGATLFGIWYTYDATGRDQWLTATASKAPNGQVFNGELRRVTGQPFSSINGSQAFLTAPVVGSVSFTFSNGKQGLMNYTLDDISQSKPLTRYGFGSPGAKCRSAAGQSTSAIGLQSVTR